MFQTASASSVYGRDDGTSTRRVSLHHKDSSVDHVHHSWHSATLLEQLNAMRLEEGLTDICLQSEDGRQFPCHRVVLAATFPYFRSMFVTSRMGEEKADEVVLGDIPGSILGQFVEYCYTGSLLLTEDTITAVAQAANCLQFTAIEKECEWFLQERLNASNSLETEKVANRLFNRRLSTQAHSCSVGNFTEATLSQEFLEFSPVEMEDFISRDVGVDSEEEVYEGVMRWVDHDQEGRKGALVLLFKNLLFEVMTEAYVLEIAAKEKLLPESEECMKIVKKALSFHTAHAKALPWKTPSSSNPLHCRAQSMRNYSEVMILIGHLEFRYHEQGGHSKASNLLMYDPKHQKWDELPGSPFGNGGVEFLTAATVINNDILVSTNQHRVWMYLTRQNKWSLLTDRLEGRNGGRLVTLDNEVFILGGLKPVETTRLTAVQLFNPISKQWLDVAPMKQGLLHIAATACLGKIYVLGSSSGSRYVSEMFCYCPVNDKWTDCAPLPSGLMRPKMVAVNGSLYVLGHQSDFAMAMLCFVNNQKWASVDAPMIARLGATLTVCNNKLFLLGGKVYSSDYSEEDEFEIECYDPDSKTWTIHGKVPWILNGHHTVSVLSPAFPPSRFLGPTQH